MILTWAEVSSLSATLSSLCVMQLLCYLAMIQITPHEHIVKYGFLNRNPECWQRWDGVHYKQTALWDFFHRCKKNKTQNNNTLKIVNMSSARAYSNSIVEIIFIPLTFCLQWAKLFICQSSWVNVLQTFWFVLIIGRTLACFVSFHLCAWQSLYISFPPNVMIFHVFAVLKRSHLQRDVWSSKTKGPFVPALRNGGDLKFFSSFMVYRKDSGDRDSSYKTTLRWYTLTWSWVPIADFVFEIFIK